MIDFHCHLDLYPDPKKVIEVCKERKLSVLSVTTTPSAWHGTCTLAGSEAGIYTALGLHPQIAHERYRELDLFERLLPVTDYVGEIGLDGSSEFKPYWSTQMTVFQSILDSCQRSGGRVMSIHSRCASSSVLDLLEIYLGSGTPILHWFSGSVRDLNRAIELGCWFSVGPAMLRSVKGRNLFSRMPKTRILTESDGPFARVNGRSMFPWDIERVIPELACIWNVTVEECDRQLHQNLERLMDMIRDKKSID